MGPSREEATQVSHRGEKLGGMGNPEKGCQLLKICHWVAMSIIIVMCLVSCPEMGHSADRNHFLKAP